MTHRHTTLLDSTITITLFIVIALAVFAAGYGYIINLSILMNAPEVSLSVFIRILGILIVPLGSILGYIPA